MVVDRYDFASDLDRLMRIAIADEIADAPKRAGKDLVELMPFLRSDVRRGDPLWLVTIYGRTRSMVRVHLAHLKDSKE